MTPKPIYDKVAGICYSPEPVTHDNKAPMCMADTPHGPATPTASAASERFAARFRNMLAQRSVHQSRSLFAQSFGSVGASANVAASSPNASAMLGLLAAGPLGLLVSAIGCSNSDDVSEGPPAVPADSNQENPNPSETPADGLGDPKVNFASSDCTSPADMAASGVAGSLAALCGDDISFGLEAGARLLEMVRAVSSDVTPLQIGDSSSVTVSTPGGDQNVKVRYQGVLGTSGDNIIAGFRYAGNDNSLESDSTGALKAASGVRLVSTADGSVSTTHLFEEVDVGLPGAGQATSNHELPEGVEVNTVQTFTPNSPVDMTQSGALVWTANSNLMLNQAIAEWNQSQAPGDRRPVTDYAPITLHAYDANSLDPASINSGDVFSHETGADSNAIMLGGYFNPAGIATLSDGRLVVVAQGAVPAEGVINNPSSLIVVDPTTTAFTAYPLSGSPELPFRATDQRGVAVVTINDTPHAVIGSGGGDSTGRVAIVNLDTGLMVPSEFPVGVFNTPSIQSSGVPEVAAVITDPDDTRRVFVVSKPNDSGNIYATTLWVQDVPELQVSAGDIGPIKTVATGVDPASRVTAEVSGGNLVVHHNQSFSSAPIVSTGG